MSTITSKDIVATMVDNDGYYPGDPQMHAIYEYESMGEIVWKVCISKESELEMLSSPYVSNPRLLWSKEQGKVGDPS